MSAERIAELEEKVAQLRQELHLEPQRHEVDKLQAAFSLSRHQALILAAIYNAGSSWMPLERLEQVLPDRGDDPRGVDTVLVQICRLRKRMGVADAILSMRDAGYTLGAPGVLACRRALGNEVAA